MKHIKILTTSVVLIMLATASCQAPPEQHTRSFVLTLGEDTVIVESFLRTNNQIQGKIIQRIPVTRVADYQASLTSSGTINNLNVTWSTPVENPEGPPPASYTISIEDTTATITRQGSWGGNMLDTTYTKSVPPGTIPLVNTTPFALSLFEQAVSQATITPGDSVASVPTIHPQGRQASTAKITKLSDDMYSWERFGSPILGRFNEQNELTWFSAEQTTMKFKGEQASNIDFNRLASRFAVLDTEGQGLGRMSETDEISQSLDGATLTVKYSRPLKRGRTIWGELVPWNKVWRTGANAATHFTTDKDLVMGGAEMPAGTYTLFSTFAPDSAILIVNSQTGQWGTQYDPDLDFARIPMQETSLDESVEKFTIAIEDTDSGGVLRLIWDRTAYEVPFTVEN